MGVMYVSLHFTLSFYIQAWWWSWKTGTCSLLTVHIYTIVLDIECNRPLLHTQKQNWRGFICVI